MAFIPSSPLVAKVAVEGRFQGETIVNTLWFEKTDETEWNTTDLGLLLVGVELNLSENIMPLLSTGYIIDRLYATKQDSNTSLFNERIPTGLNGGVLSEGLPSNVAVAVKFASAIMGRSYRGRNFVGGIPETMVDNNDVEATFRANLAGAYSGLNTAVQESVSAIHVVCSHYNNGAARALGVTVPVLSYSVRKSKVNTMRGRV